MKLLINGRWVRKNIKISMDVKFLLESTILILNWSKKDQVTMRDSCNMSNSILQGSEHKMLLIDSLIMKLFKTERLRIKTDLRLMSRFSSLKSFRSMSKTKLKTEHCLSNNNIIGKTTWCSSKNSWTRKRSQKMRRIMNLTLKTSDLKTLSVLKSIQFQADQPNGRLTHGRINRLLNYVC